MGQNIDNISINEIIDTFRQCNNGVKVMQHFGYKNNGSGYRFLKKIEEKAGINSNDYFNRITKEKYLLSPNKCLCCGKEFPFEKRRNKFCDSSCAAKYNNFKRGPMTIETKMKISMSLKNEVYSEDISSKIKEQFNKNCLMCGKPSGKKDYCCVDCKKKHIKQQKINEWLEGKSNPQRGIGQIPEYIKEYLKEIHDNKCEKCGWSEINPMTGKVPLQIHHIDGDCTNNDFNNLQILCPNCHSLTETFGSLNKISKRFHREKLKKTK